MRNADGWYEEDELWKDEIGGALLLRRWSTASSLKGKA
jgi:hypothetical protein